MLELTCNSSSSHSIVMVSRPQPQLQPLWNHEHYDPCHVIPNHVMATSSCSRSWFLPPEFSSWLSDGKTIWELVCVRNSEKRETTEDKIFLTGKVQAVNQENVFHHKAQTRLSQWCSKTSSTSSVGKTPMFWFSLPLTSWKRVTLSSGRSGSPDQPARQRAACHLLKTGSNGYLTIIHFHYI